MSLFHKERIQQDRMDCGSFCLVFLVEYYGRTINIDYVREISGASRNGVSLYTLNKASMMLGFSTRAIRVKSIETYNYSNSPFIAYVDGNHFVIVKKIRNNRVFLYDPAIGNTKQELSLFIKRWKCADESYILLECTPEKSFYKKDFPKEKETKLFPTIFVYLTHYRGMLLKIVASLLLGSFIQFLLPVLTKNVVDIGIEGKNIHALIIILTGQIMLVISSVLAGFIESRIILYIGSRINAHLVYDLFNKLVRLPISFFGTRQSGDILQRIADQGRIENFITNSLLAIISVVFNLLIFGFLLIKYSFSISLIVITGQIIYIIWAISFWGQRRRLDYELFSRVSSSQDCVIEIVRGMQEIKLNNCYQNKIAKWLHTKKNLYETQIKNIKMIQVQQTGITLIGELLNVSVLFISAISVISGNLTYGTMLAIQAISGQLTGSINEALSLVNDVQDTTIATERLAHISNHKQENLESTKSVNIEADGCDIQLNNLTFTYSGAEKPVLKNISLKLPKQGVTAVVGMSGSGKTTLLKLLLGFYQPDSGEITIQRELLSNMNLDSWRNKCGIVMQDGYIFAGTIAENICPSSQIIDNDRLWEAAKIARIDSYIKSLPLAMNTLIGMNGKDLSGGQKQRILIARAIYKNPKVLMFDEATNSLDAENEREIWTSMQQLFRNKTCIIIAHRLSTIKFANCIAVLDKGELVEVGTHQELMERKGKYYTMINSQLQA